MIPKTRAEQPRSHLGREGGIVGRVGVVAEMGGCKAVFEKARNEGAKKGWKRCEVTKKVGDRDLDDIDLVRPGCNCRNEVNGNGTRRPNDEQT